MGFCFLDKIVIVQRKFYLGETDALCPVKHLLHDNIDTGNTLLHGHSVLDSLRRRAKLYVPCFGIGEISAAGKRYVVEVLLFFIAHVRIYFTPSYRNKQGNARKKKPDGRPSGLPFYQTREQRLYFQHEDQRNRE